MGIEKKSILVILLLLAEAGNGMFFFRARATVGSFCDPQVPSLFLMPTHLKEWRQ